MGQFPTIKARCLLAVLEREPLNYRLSPVRFASPDKNAGTPHADLRLHDKATVPSGLVRKVLVKDGELAEDEARKLL